MRLRSLSLAVVLSTGSVIAAFAASAATPTPSVMVTPTPLADAVVLEASFVSGNGREIWICIASQFDGTIENIAVRTDLDRFQRFQPSFRNPQIARGHAEKAAKPLRSVSKIATHSQQS